MTYKLAFNESALKEWKKLGHTIQEQFKKNLALSVRLSPVLSFNLAVNMTMRSIWLVLSLSFQACWSSCL